MEQHLFFTDTVKLGKKGQITIPKKIRDEDELREEDIFIVLHAPGGEIILQKQKTKAPEDLMLEAIHSAPKFDWRKAWEEVKAERRRERA